MNEKYGKYIVLDYPEPGGQSEVWKVRHKEYGYIRALSVTLFKKEDIDGQWKKFKERCGRLLRLCNGNHPNIVHCYTPELDGQEAYFEMDFIQGENLKGFLEKNNYFLPIEEILNMIVQMSNALEYCHYGTYEFSVNPDTDKDPVTGDDLVKIDENDNKKFVPVDDNALEKLVKNHQVVHNDISSKNIMRSNNGTYVLIDFGLSVEGNEIVDPGSIRSKEGHREYMAPERWNGRNPPTPQSDIYSFGIVMYEYLTGHVPFKLVQEPSADYSRLEDDHCKKQVPSITEMRKKAFEQKFPGQEYVREKELDWLEEVILKCLEKKPGDRYKDGNVLRTVVFDHLPKDSSVYKEEELKILKKTNDDLLSEMQSLKEELNKLAKFKICKKCGIPSFADSIFCRNCGIKFDV